MAKLVDRPKPDLVIQSYIPEIIRGLKVSNRHFWVNLLTRKNVVTLQYPEEKNEYPARFRGQHRLMKREDESVRCVACFLCATACPADCMIIKAGERDDSNEKYPISFDIDYIKCIFCGMCEEACPCDAIRLDTGIHKSPAYTRGDELMGKVDLLARGALSVAKQGGEFK